MTGNARLTDPSGRLLSAHVAHAGLIVQIWHAIRAQNGDIVRAPRAISN